LKYNKILPKYTIKNILNDILNIHISILDHCEPKAENIKKQIFLHSHNFEFSSLNLVAKYTV